MYEIEKNVPLVGKGIGRNAKYPLASMEIGDSFVVPLKYPEQRNALNSAVSIFAKRHGRKFATRRIDNSVRVWRIA
jgi:hypothetical protein